MDNKLCFVITPYGTRDIGDGVVVDFEDVYKNIIKKGVELIKGHQLELKRSKDEREPGCISAGFIRSILKADVAIVDVSSGVSHGNANVFYELGLRHAFRKRISLIIAVEETRPHLPFDIKDMRVVFYDYRTPAGRAKAAWDIADYLGAALNNSNADSPVFQFIPEYRVVVPPAKCTAKYDCPFVVKDCPGKQIGIKSGELSDIRGIDVWVNSENTEMEMGRTCDQSVSGWIRFLGATRQGQSVKRDLIQEYLRRELGRRRSVQPTEVIATPPGGLRANGVRMLLHVAAFQGVHGVGYHLVPDVGLCVRNVLSELQSLNSRMESNRAFSRILGGGRSPYRSVLFPIVGVRTIDPDRALGDLVTAACNYLARNPGVTTDRIYFLANSEDEWRLCNDVMKRHPGLRELTTSEMRASRQPHSRPSGIEAAAKGIAEIMTAARQWRGKDEKRMSDYLEQGMIEGQAALSTGQRDVGLACRMADCLGMLAGSLVRQGRVGEALAVYRDGRDLEMDPESGVKMTYNTVNLLVTRLLVDGWQTVADAREDIDEAIRRIDARVHGDGRDDLWAWADLGMCEFLRGNYREALIAYRKAAALDNEANRQSMLDKLLEIRDRYPEEGSQRCHFFEQVAGVLSPSATDG